MPIVTSTYRYKRPPRKWKGSARTHVPVIVTLDQARSVAPFSAWIHCG